MRVDVGDALQAILDRVDALGHRMQQLEQAVTRMTATTRQAQVAQARKMRQARAAKLLCEQYGVDLSLGDFKVLFGADTDYVPADAKRILKREGYL